MVIGTCSLCSGRVSVPDAWLSVIPPVPTCETCGAVKASHGPVIEMTPSKTWTSNQVTITKHSAVSRSTTAAQAAIDYVDHIRQVTGKPSEK